MTVCVFFPQLSIYRQPIQPVRCITIPPPHSSSRHLYVTTGMIWGGFRPSDDPQTHGFNVPANMYAAVALKRLAALNDDVWKHPDIHTRAKAMADAIRHGITTHGIVINKGQRVYAYEVDGFGTALAQFDDPNLPSLLSIPLLGYPFDLEVYQATRDMVLSGANQYFYASSNVSGLGSPHTPSGNVWPLGLMTDALTTHDPHQQASIIRTVRRDVFAGLYLQTPTCCSG